MARNDAVACPRLIDANILDGYRKLGVPEE
jgi:hypothetical protein